MLLLSDVKRIEASQNGNINHGLYLYTHLKSNHIITGSHVICLLFRQWHEKCIFWYKWHDWHPFLISIQNELLCKNLGEALRIFCTHVHNNSQTKFITPFVQHLNYRIVSCEDKLRSLFLVNEENKTRKRARHDSTQVLNCVWCDLIPLYTRELTLRMCLDKFYITYKEDLSIFASSLLSDQQATCLK